MDFRRFKTISVEPSTQTVVVKVAGKKIPSAKEIAATAIPVPGKVTLYHESDGMDAGTFKQWSIWIEPTFPNDPKDLRHNVVTEWGREGHKLQVNRKTFRSHALATFAMNKTLRTKKRDGYRSDK